MEVWQKAIFIKLENTHFWRWFSKRISYLFHHIVNLKPAENQPNRALKVDRPVPLRLWTECVSSERSTLTFCKFFLTEGTEDTSGSLKRNSAHVITFIIPTSPLLWLLAWEINSQFNGGHWLRPEFYLRGILLPKTEQTTRISLYHTYWTLFVVFLGIQLMLRLWPMRLWPMTS